MVAVVAPARSAVLPGARPSRRAVLPLLALVALAALVAFAPPAGALTVASPEFGPPGASAAASPVAESAAPGDGGPSFGPRLLFILGVAGFAGFVLLLFAWPGGTRPRPARAGVGLHLVGLAAIAVAEWQLWLCGPGDCGLGGLPLVLLSLAGTGVAGLGLALLAFGLARSAPPRRAPLLALAIAVAASAGGAYAATLERQFWLYLALAIPAMAASAFAFRLARPAAAALPPAPALS